MDETQFDATLVLPVQFKAMILAPCYEFLVHSGGNFGRNSLPFAQQRPQALPVSLRRFHVWNLKSWSPTLPSNHHKTWIIRMLLQWAPVLLQESKWDATPVQYISHV